MHILADDFWLNYEQIANVTDQGGEIRFLMFIADFFSTFFKQRFTGELHYLAKLTSMCIEQTCDIP